MTDWIYNDILCVEPHIPADDWVYPVPPYPPYPPSPPYPPPPGPYPPYPPFPPFPPYPPYPPWPIDSDIGGDILCITLPGGDGDGVYPSLAWIRVTSLVHRWSPGRYTLTLGLGELTTDFEIPDIILRPPILAPEVVPPPTPGPYDCVYQGAIYPQGSYVCQGVDKYVCFEGRWLIALLNAPECQGVGEYGCMYQGAIHPQGSYVCMGYDKFVCFEGRWLLALKDAPECR